jgi:hypothetical protein
MVQQVYLLRRKLHEIKISIDGGVTSRFICGVEKIQFTYSRITGHYVRFQVLTAASMKFRVFRDVAPCGYVEVDRSFRGAYCLHHQGDDPPA